MKSNKNLSSLRSEAGVRSWGRSIVAFLRSMRFGMILLAAIAALSIVGTLVTQGRTAAYYEQAYGALGKALVFFGVDHLYGTWYYVALFAALCLNLLLCSVLRLNRLRGAKAALIARAAHAQPQAALDGAAIEACSKKLGYRPAKDGVYLRHTLGLYGSFVTHVGMLLLVIAAACVFGLEEKESIYLLTGEYATLSDGCVVTVDAFSMKNAAGQLDYISSLSVTGKDGQTLPMTTTVNHPARFDEHTVYQQSYAFAGVLDVQTGADAPAEQVVLDGAAFISLDGVNGVYYMQVYGDYTEMDDGQLMPKQAMGMVRPVYLLSVIEGENQTMHVVLPDETFEVGGVYYTFRAPLAYPGLTIKTQARWVTPVLYASFAVLVLGLYLCFFHVPAALMIAADGVRIASGKDPSDELARLEDAMKDEDAEEKENAK